MKLFGKSKLEKAVAKAHAAHAALRAASDHHGSAAQSLHDHIDVVRNQMHRMIKALEVKRDFHDAQGHLADDLACRLGAALEDKTD